MTLDPVKFIEDWARGSKVLVDEYSVRHHLIPALKTAMETEYVGPLYRTDYFVAGRGAFPVDMLRYTQSWPAGEGDAGAIDCSLREDALGIEDPRTVKLTKYHRDPRPVLSEDRWQSKFHWKLVGVVETTEL